MAEAENGEVGPRIPTDLDRQCTVITGIVMHKHSQHALGKALLCRRGRQQGLLGGTGPGAAPSGVGMSVKARARLVAVPSLRLCGILF